MPVYDYKCQVCGEISEILIRSGRNDFVKCPVCGSSKMDRLLSSSYLVKMESRDPGNTCCGRKERCESPPCSFGGNCGRH